MTRDKKIIEDVELSIVVPAHNEGDGLRNALDAIAAAASECTESWEIIAIDDGSQDATWQEIDGAVQSSPKIRGIRFSRNFGKEAALLAGLRAAEGRAVVTMDGDLQHPPDLLPEMYRLWEEGAKIVHAVKRNRTTESKMTIWRAKIFNTILTRLGGIDLGNASDFKLIDRVIVDVLTVSMSEKKRFYRGLTSWVGFPSVKVEFDVPHRAQGHGNWTLRQLLDLSVTALVSFTSAPLRIVTFLGGVTLVFGFIVVTDALISWLRGIAVSGFVTLIGTLLVIGSMIMISLGVIGEYIAKIYDEIKARPAYLIESQSGFESTPASDEAGPLVAYEVSGHEHQSVD
jgi:glycosyltransferase involved in cell wall biosynthesis